MDRLTKKNIEVKPNYILEFDIKDIVYSDKLVDLILNGPTLMSVSKTELRVITRKLYAKLKEYEDLEEQGKLVRVIRCKECAKLDNINCLASFRQKIKHTIHHVL